MAISTIPSAGITGGGFTFRNIIINGDMSIHQRGTNATASNGFGVDRFTYNDAQNFDERVFTFGQDTDVPTGQGFAKSMKVNVTTPETTIASDEYARIMTRLEGQNLQQLKFGTSSAESVTLSFWLKTNVTGNFAVSLFLDDDSRIIGTTYSATSSGVWEKITITFVGDTTGVIDNDNGSGLRVMFITDAGSNFTSSDNTSWGSYSNAKLGYGQTASVFGTTSGYWNVTGVQLEVGTTASDFEFLPYDVNLQRCQRYYEKSYDYGTTAGTATEIGTSSLNGLSTSSKQIRSHDTRFTVEKRANPTVTIYDKSGNSGKWTTYDSGGSGTDNVAYGGVITKNTKSFDIYSSGTTAAGYQFHYTADAEL
jgi:hypothetical protein